MKKILLLAAAATLLQGTVIAQNLKPVPEKDVRVNYVKDFQRQVKQATDIAWWQVDSLTYKVTFLDNENSRQAMVFSNKGSETHYIIEKQYYPSAIKDTVSHLFPKHTIQEVWVRKMRGKMTYQARIALKKGFLWWKKVVDTKVLNFEVDGKFISAE
jgi:hypothetical protein